MLILKRFFRLFVETLDNQVFIDTGLLACARRKDMHKHNVDRVKALGTDIAPIVADSSPREARGEQNDKAASLPHKIILCEGAKIRLTDNLWTEAGMYVYRIWTSNYVVSLVQLL